jgi:hypothetical protein
MTDPQFEFTAIYDYEGMSFTPHGWASPHSQSRLRVRNHAFPIWVLFRLVPTLPAFDYWWKNT